jgi:hypothetical protein
MVRVQRGRLEGEDRYKHKVPRDYNWLHVEQQIQESPGLVLRLYKDAINEYERVLDEAA